MPKKKSVKKSVETFLSDVGQIREFVELAQDANPSKQFMTYVVELSIVKLYTAFERLMLDAIIGAINNDTTTLAKATGIDFPKHLTDKVCEFLVVGTGYFGFRGRDGLIDLLKDYVPEDHYILTAVKKQRYKDALEKLSALRNFAAHESHVSKVRAKAAAGCNLGSAGSWLKRQGRFQGIADRIEELASEIGAAARF